MVVILISLLFLALGAILLRDGLTKKDKISGQPKKNILLIVLGVIFLILFALTLPATIKNVLALLNLR